MCLGSSSADRQAIIKYSVWVVPTSHPGLMQAYVHCADTDWGTVDGTAKENMIALLAVINPQLTRKTGLLPPKC